MEAGLIVCTRSLAPVDPRAGKAGITSRAVSYTHLLDSNNGFAFLRLSLTVDVAASIVAGKLIGVHPRYATAAVFNQAAVVQVV